MWPVRRALLRALLLFVVISPAVMACGHATPTPGGSGSPVASAAGGPSPQLSASAAAPSRTPPGAVPAPAATPRATAESGWTVVSSRVAYPWRWPNGDNATVEHAPSAPHLIMIRVGDHPGDPGEIPFNRMSFTFDTGFPSYSFQFVPQLIADGSGQPIPLPGLGVLRIVFHPAQAHTDDGKASTIQSQPPAQLNLIRMAGYARGGDFEGYLSYGIGIAWPYPHSNPQIGVRAYEVTYRNATGGHRYVVAIDVDAH
jgi:hypothetical protein